MEHINVLLVEDTSIAIIYSLKLFKSFSFNVDVAESGNQAIELINSKPYHIIFIDLGLPEARDYGLNVIKQTRESNTINSKAFIVALTAHGERSYAEQCFVLGANKYVTKPLSYDAVQELLREFYIARDSQNAI